MTGAAPGGTGGPACFPLWMDVLLCGALRNREDTWLHTRMGLQGIGLGEGTPCDGNATTHLSADLALL